MNFQPSLLFFTIDNFPDNNYEGSSDRSSALSTPSPQSHPRQSHLPSETHHPSLRRRKWLDKPTQQVRQSTLEKSLSLQAELAQHRPLSMIVPFGSDSNAIVSQVADSLLQQVCHILSFKLLHWFCV